MLATRTRNFGARRWVAPPLAVAAAGLLLAGAACRTGELTPGDYAAICVIPDRASGIPHLHLGMIKGFTVR